MTSPANQSGGHAPERSAGFAPTRWALVLQARGQAPESRIALSELCDAYYKPVEAFIRHFETNPENARDLTHSFFEDLLCGRGVATAEPGRGRFRSYLLGAVKHFLAEWHRKAGAAKRGFGKTPVSLQSGVGAETTAEIHVPDPSGPVPDMWFDRHWATTLVDRAAEALAKEAAANGKNEHFAALKPWLTAAAPPLSQAEAAQTLGVSEAAVKVAIHRLRKRFRELVKAEIAETVNDASQVAEELHYLVEVLAQLPSLDVNWRRNDRTRRRKGF